MKQQKMAEIEKLLALKFQKKQSSIAKINAQEARLREQITSLDAHSNASSPEGNDGMRAIGADVVWKAWVGQTKMKLNLELAQVLAQKEILLGGVRKDYGKLSVVQNLINLQQSKRKSEHQERALRKATDAHLFK